jgi:hypothetical protein
VPVRVQVRDPPYDTRYILRFITITDPAVLEYVIEGEPGLTLILTPGGQSFHMLSSH